MAAKRTRVTTSASVLKREAEMTRIIELRATAGWSLQQIADELGVTRQSVHERVKRYQEKRHEYNAELLQAFIGRQHDDLRADIAKLSSLITKLEVVLVSGMTADDPCVDKTAVNGVIAALNAKRGYYEREAKLLGLDAATKTSLSGPDGEPVALSVFAVPLEEASRQAWVDKAKATAATDEAAAEALINAPVPDDDDE
jgi:predicted DNA-binding protein YlxM (UPF0122 family)